MNGHVSLFRTLKLVDDLLKGSQFRVEGSLLAFNIASASDAGRAIALVIRRDNPASPCGVSDGYVGP
jgi:hypothetical protein